MSRDILTKCDCLNIPRVATLNSIIASLPAPNLKTSSSASKTVQQGLPNHPSAFAHQHMHMHMHMHL